MLFSRTKKAVVMNLIDIVDKKSVLSQQGENEKANHLHGNNGGCFFLNR